jgi:hypothetical protein
VQLDASPCRRVLLPQTSNNGCVMIGLCDYLSCYFTGTPACLCACHVCANSVHARVCVCMPMTLHTDGGAAQVCGAAGAGAGHGGAGLPLLARARGEARRLGAARDAARGAHGRHCRGPAPDGGGRHRRPLRAQRRVARPRRPGSATPSLRHICPPMGQSYHLVAHQDKSSIGRGKWCCAALVESSAAAL